MSLIPPKPLAPEEKRVPPYRFMLCRSHPLQIDLSYFTYAGLSPVGATQHLARAEGFDPSSCGFGDRCSALNYTHIKGAAVARVASYASCKQIKYSRTTVIVLLLLRQNCVPLQLKRNLYRIRGLPRLFVLHIGLAPLPRRARRPYSLWIESAMQHIKCRSFPAASYENRRIENEKRFYLWRRPSRSYIIQHIYNSRLKVNWSAQIFNCSAVQFFCPSFGNI